MRDIFIVLVVLGSVPFIFARPYIGVLMWNWLSLMNPHRLAWGVARTLPVAQTVAIATFLGMFFSKEPKRIPWTRETILLILFISWMLVTTFFAFNQVGAWMQWNKVWKIQLMIFMTLILLRRAEHIRALIWIIVVSVGFYGVKGGIFTITTGGNYLVWGPDGSFIAGNNEIGLALIMIIPLMRYLQLTSEHWWIRVGLTAAIALSAVCILGTHSRGALVGIAAMLLFLLLKSRKRVTFAFVLALVIVASLLVMPQAWFDRMNTIRTYEEDASAMGRVNAWWFAYNLAKDRPAVGGGFETFRAEFFRIYAPEPYNTHDAHSIFFEVLGEHGFVGLSLFIILGLFTWRSCSWLIKRARDDPELANFGDMAKMIQVSMVGYGSAGAFLGLAYFDLYYNLIAIVILSKTMVRELLEEMATEDGDETFSEGIRDEPSEQYGNELPNPI